MGKQFLHLYCPDCRGDRLHGFRASKQPDGRVLRVRYCTTCEAEAVLAIADVPGTCCRHCGDVRLSVYYTRHLRPGVTARVKRCRHCRKKTPRITEFDGFALAKAIADRVSK